MTSVDARQLGPPVTAPRVYYFGCSDRAGHRWYQPAAEGKLMLGSAAVADAMRTVFPDIDCGFPPKAADGAHYQVEGEASLTLIRGWTVLAWWDRSVDNRHNSNSALVVDVERDFDQMVALLAIHFPEVSKRQRAPIKFVQLEVGS